MKIKTDDLEKLCNEVIETSLGWTSTDEDAIPGLKRIRTLAGLFLTQIEKDKPQKRSDQELPDPLFRDYLLNHSR